jgi:hypothetical protein
MVEEWGHRLRFDFRLLDAEDPFEIDDGNRPHLLKHLPVDGRRRPVAVGPEDILDVYLYGDPSFFEAKEGGPADWLMIGIVPGLTICVPLAPPNSGAVERCRPIGIYRASETDKIRYLRGDTDE